MMQKTLGLTLGHAECVALGMLCLVTGMASGAVWQGDGKSHLTITNAADYSLSSNWTDDLMPTTTTGANFNNAAEGTFIRTTSKIEARSLLTCNDKYGDARNVYLIAEEGVTGTCPSKVNVHLLWIGPTVYGDLTTDAPLMTWTAYLCGDMTSTANTKYDAPLVVASGTFYHRMDRYANQAGGARTNAIKIAKLSQGSGDYVFRAPASCATNVMGKWNQVAGSPYLFPAAGTSHVLPVGTTVTGDGIPDATFLKRVFPDGSIELSKAVEAGKTLDANTLTFAAQRAVVLQEFPSYQTMSSSQEYLYLDKFREEDDVTMVLDNISTAYYDGSKDYNATLIFGCSSGYKPGRIIFGNATYSKSQIMLHNCHLQLGSTGLGSSCVRMDWTATTHTARVTVTNGITASLGVNARYLIGTFVKDGAGTLTLPLLTSPRSNTGTVRVEAGTLKVTAASEGAYLGTLDLQTGTKLILPTNVLEVGAISVASSGVTISGPGLLAVPQGTDLSNVTFENDARVRFSGESTPMTWTLPVTNVPGTPVLWVDASRTNTMELKIDGSNIYVTRINDVRGSEYFFATNASPTRLPNLNMTTLEGKMPYVEMKEIALSPTINYPTNTYALVWDREITGIRSVFMVHRVTSKGTGALGDLLGNYKRGSDFARPSGIDSSYFIIWGGSPCEAVLNSVCYLDGVQKKRSNPYNAERSVEANNGVGGGVLPVLTEVHTRGGTAVANCWGYDQGTLSSGYVRLCECIVYTNELTETERLQIAGYLMRKWEHEEPSWTPLAEGGQQTLQGGSGAALEVAEGMTNAFLSVTGNGNFAKTGKGTLELGSYVHTAGTMTVKDGTVVVGSGLDDSVMPAGACMHVDAEKNVTYTTLANGDKRVSQWDDSRTDGKYNLAVWANQTNYPTLKAVISLGGKNVVDMGPFISSSSAFGSYTPVNGQKASRALQLMKGTTSVEEVATLRTAFWMMGSSQGGGSLLGGAKRSLGETQCGLQRNGGSNYATSLLRNDSVHSTWRTGNPFQVNGTPVAWNQADVLSGGYDVVSFRVLTPFGFNSIGSNHYDWWTGGMELGEFLAYYERLSTSTVARVEQYLQQKWFGTEPKDYPQAKASAVTVASGATLKVQGDLPLQATSLQGGGTIEGNVTLTAGATFDAAEGAMGGLNVTGTLDLSAGGTVCLLGDARMITPGHYAILTAGTLKGGTWNVSCGKGRTTKLTQVGNTLYLDVREPGTVVIVR